MIRVYVDLSTAQAFSEKEVKKYISQECAYEVEEIMEEMLLNDYSGEELLDMLKDKYVDELRERAEQAILRDNFHVNEIEI